MIVFSCAYLLLWSAGAISTVHKKTIQEVKLVENVISERHADALWIVIMHYYVVMAT